MSLTGELNGEHAEQRQRTIVTRAAPSASRVAADGALNYPSALHLRLPLSLPVGLMTFIPPRGLYSHPLCISADFLSRLSNCQPSRYTKLRQQRTAGGSSQLDLNPSRFLPNCDAIITCCSWYVCRRLRTQIPQLLTYIPIISWVCPHMLKSALSICIE